MGSFRSCAMVVAGVTALSAFVAACGGGDDDSSSTASKPNGPVTLTWWHNGTTDPLKGVWQQTADSFKKANPNVTIKVNPIQNEQFTTKVPVALQSSSPPDVFQQWGGGQEATQIRSGKLMDLTKPLANEVKTIGTAAEGWAVDGKQFGVPFSLHIVGFWYRKDLFKKAGVEPPKTIDDLKAAVGKLKAAGVVPIAIGSKDRWPDAFWWEYFALRHCPTDTIKQAMEDVKLDDPCFTKASDSMKDFLAVKPFQPGFLGTPAQQGAGSSAGMLANGKAAMELQGTWEPGVLAGLTDDKKIASKLGWFPFPEVPGGGGDQNSALGGGDGFSCTTKATTACQDFLKHILGDEVQKSLVSSGAVALPVNPAAASAIKDATVKEVLDYTQQASFVQTYFDVALPTAQGQALNEAIANFFAGKGDAEGINKSVE